MTGWLALMAALLFPATARAAEDPAAYVWHQRPGARLALDATLRDETGRPFALGRAFGRAPVILDLGYYDCPSLCGVVRADLMNALANGGLAAGRDYELVALSIDPAETAADAARAKAADLARAPGTGAAWHYLTGDAGTIAAVEDTVGFPARYDERLKQFLHPAGIAVLTRDGVVSGYLLGVGYAGGDLRAAVLRAGEGGVAQAALPILLLCFHYDPQTGRYTLAIERVLRVMAGLTALTLGGLLLALHRRGPGRPMP